MKPSPPVRSGSDPTSANEDSAMQTDDQTATPPSASLSASMSANNLSVTATHDAAQSKSNTAAAAIDNAANGKSDDTKKTIKSNNAAADDTEAKEMPVITSSGRTSRRPARMTQVKASPTKDDSADSGSSGNATREKQQQANKERRRRANNNSAKDTSAASSVDSNANNGTAIESEVDVNKTPTDKNDVPQPTHPSQRTDGTANVDYHWDANNQERDYKLYCNCKQIYNPTRSMIACDGCEEWYHISCVGVASSVADKLSTWYCPDCREKGLGQPLKSKANNKASARQKQYQSDIDDVTASPPNSASSPTQSPSLEAEGRSDSSIKATKDAKEKSSTVKSEAMEAGADSLASLQNNAVKHEDSDAAADETSSTAGDIQYSRTGRPQRSAAPIQSMKEIDTVGDLGSGRKVASKPRPAADRHHHHGSAHRSSRQPRAERDDDAPYHAPSSSATRTSALGTSTLPTRTAMLRPRAHINPPSGSATRASALSTHNYYNMYHAASRIATLSNGARIRVRWLLDGESIWEDEYNEAAQWLVVEHDVDELNDWWGNYQQHENAIEDDDPDNVYVTSDDSDLDIDKDLAPPFPRPEPVMLDSDGNQLIIDNGHMNGSQVSESKQMDEETSEERKEHDADKEALMVIEQKEPANSTESTEAKSQAIARKIETTNRVIYRLQRRQIDADSISDEFDDLGWNAVLHGDESLDREDDNDRASLMNATDTDKRLLKHMEQRKIEIECILLQLEASKRRLYAAFANAYRLSVKEIGRTAIVDESPSQQRLSAHKVRLGRRRNNVTNFANSNLSNDSHDGSTSPRVRQHTTGLSSPKSATSSGFMRPRSLLKRRRSSVNLVTTSAGRLVRRSSLAQNANELADESEEDEQVLYMDVLECSGCGGKVPASSFYMHVKACSTVAEAPMSNETAPDFITQLPPSTDKSRYTQHGIPMNLPISSHPWQSARCSARDLWLNEWTADDVVKKYKRLETFTVCGCPLNIKKQQKENGVSVNAVIPVADPSAERKEDNDETIEYCTLPRSQCGKHLLWDEQWRSEIETQYFLNIRRLELIEAEIETCKDRLYNRYMLKQLILDEETLKLWLQLQAEAVADAAGVSTQIQLQQDAIDAQTKADLENLQMQQQAFKQRYLQQQEELMEQEQAELEAELQSDVPAPIPQPPPPPQAHAPAQQSQQAQHQHGHMQPQPQQSQHLPPQSQRPQQSPGLSHAQLHQQYTQLQNQQQQQQQTQPSPLHFGLMNQPQQLYPTAIPQQSMQLQHTDSSPQQLQLPQPQQIKHQQITQAQQQPTSLGFYEQLRQQMQHNQQHLQPHQLQQHNELMQSTQHQQQQQAISQYEAIRQIQQQQQAQQQMKSPHQQGAQNQAQQMQQQQQQQSQPLSQYEQLRQLQLQLQQANSDPHAYVALISPPHAHLGKSSPSYQAQQVQGQQQTPQYQTATLATQQHSQLHHTAQQATAVPPPAPPKQIKHATSQPPQSQHQTPHRHPQQQQYQSINITPATLYSPQHTVSLTQTARSPTMQQPVSQYTTQHQPYTAHVVQSHQAPGSSQAQYAALATAQSPHHHHQQQQQHPAIARASPLTLSQHPVMQAPSLQSYQRTH